MSGIKYYQLTKGEELPDEFCAVRDIDGEPSEYTFYVPDAENAKLRELVIAQCECVKHEDCSECIHYSKGKCTFPFKSMYRDLGLEVDE